MRRWEKYYATYPLSVGRREYLRQVGHTVHGEPIGEEELGAMVSQTCALLDLQSTDIVLDLCCGNGLITKELAKRCHRVVGVDFSRPLIEIAEEDHRLPNICYRLGNVLDIERDRVIASQKYTKILMYAALQHFQPRDIEVIMRSVLKLCVPHPIIVLGFVPDANKKRNFYDSPGRRIKYLFRRLSGRDPMGMWWSEELVIKTCGSLGLRCEFHKLPEILHASRYRFDVRMS